MPLTSIFAKKVLAKPKFSKTRFFLFFLFSFHILISMILPNAASGGTLEVVFEESPDSRVVGYNLYYGLSPDFESCLDLEEQTRFRIANLKEGTTYFLSVKGYDKYDNESDFSNVIEYCIPVLKTDSDEDDLCPSDPNKSEPGICGCGVLDEDSDGDGVADCQDYYPMDPAKSEPAEEEVPTHEEISYRLVFDESLDERVVGYNVYYGLTRKMENRINLGRDTNYVFADLREGNTYYFAASGYDKNGNESVLSEIIHFEVPLNGSEDENVVCGKFDGVEEMNGAVSSFSEQGEGDSEYWDDGTYEEKGDMQSSSDHFMEAGEVLVDHNWASVFFDRCFKNSVVVAANVASFQDPDAAIVRIRDVDNCGFDIRIQEWDCQDGFHGLELVSYIAMEEGAYLLPGDIAVEAGFFEADNYWSSTNFESSFDSVPVVVTSIISDNDPSAVSGRLICSDRDFFEYHLQGVEDDFLDSRLPETVSYIAWMPSAGVCGSLAFEVGTTAEKVASDYCYIPCFNSFSEAPLIFADIIRDAEGGGAANLRQRNRTYQGVELQVSSGVCDDIQKARSEQSIGYILLQID